jgi:hypothetical protein
MVTCNAGRERGRPAWCPQQRHTGTFIFGFGLASNAARPEYQNKRFAPSVLYGGAHRVRSCVWRSRFVTARQSAGAGTAGLCAAAHLSRRRLQVGSHNPARGLLMVRAVAFAISRTRKLIAANDVPIRAIHYVPAAARHSLIERATHARRRSTCTMIITRDGTTRHG